MNYIVNDETIALNLIQSFPKLIIKFECKRDLQNLANDFKYKYRKYK